MGQAARITVRAITSSTTVPAQPEHRRGRGSSHPGDATTLRRCWRRLNTTRLTSTRTTRTSRVTPSPTHALPQQAGRPRPAPVARLHAIRVRSGCRPGSSVTGPPSVSRSDEQATSTVAMISLMVRTRIAPGAGSGCLSRIAISTRRQRNTAVEVITSAVSTRITAAGVRQRGPEREGLQRHPAAEQRQAGADPGQEGPLVGEGEARVRLHADREQRTVSQVRRGWSSAVLGHPAGLPRSSVLPGTLLLPGRQASPARRTCSGSAAERKDVRCGRAVLEGTGSGGLTPSSPRRPPAHRQVTSGSPTTTGWPATGRRRAALPRPWLPSSSAG